MDYHKNTGTYVEWTTTKTPEHRLNGLPQNTGTQAEWTTTKTPEHRLNGLPQKHRNIG